MTHKLSVKKYKRGLLITVNDIMQHNYSYTLTENYGSNFDPEFKPEITPMKMLSLGVFEGKYLNDCEHEFPKEWFKKIKRQKRGTKYVADETLNRFKIKSRQSLQIWRKNGWIIGNDPRGWFQWYCRYYIGRREPEIDRKQIKRWKSFARHKGQILKSLPKARRIMSKREILKSHRIRQRQALLQWAYNPDKLF